MKQWPILPFLLICVRLSAQQDLCAADSIRSLTSDSLQTAFLEAIFYSDQEVRNEWSETDQTDTILLKKAMETVRMVDSINFLSVKCYLNHFPHPDRQHHSELAVLTPWLVIHHATYNDVRFEYYPILVVAYERGDLDENKILGYMARALSIENSKSFEKYYGMSINRLKRKMQKQYDRNYSR